MHAGRYGCRVQTAADTVSDETELLVRGEYACGSPLKTQSPHTALPGTFKLVSCRAVSARQWSSDFMLLKPFVINLLSLKGVSTQADLQTLQREKTVG